jgi:electron transport complex protein RnfC
MNTGNSGYVGQTRFRYEIKVHTDNVEQLQKDWGKGYQYQENAIDHAQSKDLQKFNQQIEEKKMEIVEKEDSLNPKAAQAQTEPEKSPAQREERAQPEPEAAQAAPGKDAEREAPEGATRTEQEPAERQAAPQLLHDERAEKNAERATEAAREGVVWDESVPSNTGEHEHAGSAAAPEPSPIHGQNDGATRPQEKEKPFEPYISPEDKEKIREEVREAIRTSPLVEYERAQKALIGSQSYGHDPQAAARLQEKANDAWMRLHYPQQEAKAQAQAAQAEPEKLEKGPATGEKETPQREEPAPREPERAPMPPMPPMDKMEKWAKTQEAPGLARDRDHVHEAAHEATSIEKVLGPRQAEQAQRGYNQEKTPQNQVKAPAKQQPAQHKGHDKPMEREI